MNICFWPLADCNIGGFLSDLGSAPPPKADVRLLDYLTSANDPFRTFNLTFSRSRLMPIKIAILLVAIVVTLGPATYASDPMPTWASDWSAHVWNTYCALRLEYTIPIRRNPERRGFLAGRSIDRLFARFAASTRTHFGLIPEEKLFKTRFELHFYGEDGHPVAEDDQILSAKIGEFEMNSPADPNAWILTFSLDEDKTLSLLQRFNDNEVVEVAVRFADGEERRSKIYPSGDRNFHVWAEMFKTCIRENID